MAYLDSGARISQSLGDPIRRVYAALALGMVYEVTKLGGIVEQEKALVKIEPSQALLLSPVMDVALAKARLNEFQDFIKGYMVKGEDFGTIPGTPKPTLYKPGADKLCEIYGLTDTYEITSRIENWSTNLFDYEVRCILSKRDGTRWAEGMGSCNSYEARYRWRDAQRKCPNCNKETIIKGKAEYGGGWLCFAKKGGCGAKFKEGDPVIESQSVGRVENDDMATLKNTILKMAKKRAKVDATLSATRSSGIFTQDLEDLSQDAHENSEDAPGSISFPSDGPGVAETPRSQFKASVEHELEKKIAEIHEVMKLPCFNDDDRTMMQDSLAKYKTLKNVDILLKKAQAEAKKRQKEQAKADREAQNASVTA